MRVVIAEDQVLLREGLAALLTDAGEEVVAMVGDGDALERAVAEHRPDLAIVDVRMPPNQSDEGVRAALAIRRAAQNRTAILIFSQYVEQRYASELLAGGTEGVGYLLKERVADVAEFVDAARRVAEGGTALDPEVVSQLLMVRRPAGADRLTELSPREREVLALMAEGHANVAIADRLGVTTRAVEKHSAAVFRKLDLPQSDVLHRRVLAVLTYLGV
ncbi:MAG TPA: response regulator transcription factor [Solirubrobacteraceae bacterium]|nr:response regulator transcription factor [Solirubrobacteraceae bacterium]